MCPRAEDRGTTGDAVADRGKGTVRALRGVAERAVGIGEAVAERGRGTLVAELGPGEAVCDRGY